MAKTAIKLKDLANIKKTIDISETEEFSIRGLTLREMVILFMESKDAFLPLYAVGIDGLTTEALAPFLLTSPELVAKIIALASDEPDSSKVIEDRMPATVQLIALYEIWKASVPDPKKGRELLSEVTALLQRLNNEAAKLKEPLKVASPTTVPEESNSLLPTGTP